MIAQLHGKASSIAERSEDELTGHFFGNLRYLPFSRGLKHILKSCIYPAELAGAFDKIDSEEWSGNIEFWPRENGTEPDVLLTFDDTVILIEVKYRSGVSSDDDVDNSDGSREQEVSYNQLAREARLLDRIADDREKVLIFLAPEVSAHSVYTDVTNRGLLGDVPLGYITWQKAFDALQKIEVLSPFEQIIVDDLKALLHRKGFEGFRAFDGIHCAEVDATKIWTFDYSASYKFCFAIKQAVERGLFYEFG